MNQMFSFASTPSLAAGATLLLGLATATGSVIGCSAEPTSPAPGNPAAGSGGTGDPGAGGTAPSTAGTTANGGTQPQTPSGGSPNSGGGSTGGGSGGSTASAGTGGSAPVGGGGAPPAGGCAAPTSTNPLISDFTGAVPVANQLNGTTDVWTASPAGMAQVAIVDGVMHATSTGGEWASTSAVIGGSSCFNVSSYTGIEFKIRSPTHTSIIFVVATEETKADYTHMRKTMVVTPELQTHRVPFAMLDKAGFGAGSMLPADYQPATRMTGLGFGVGVITEPLDLFVDDVTFYQ